MTLQQHFLNMALYHKWAYEKLNLALCNMSDTDYRKNNGLFFGSIHKTLNHLYLVDCLWYGRFTNTDSSIRSLDEEIYTDKTALFNAISEQATRWIDFVNPVKFDKAPEKLAYTNTKGIHISLAYASVLDHVFNHGTHHRGQISAVITQCGLSAPEMDIYYHLLELQRR